MVPTSDRRHTPRGTTASQPARRNSILSAVLAACREMHFLTMPVNQAARQFGLRLCLWACELILADLAAQEEPRRGDDGQYLRVGPEGQQFSR